jgi:hypothetical protein
MTYSTDHGEYIVKVIRVHNGWDYDILHLGVLKFMGRVQADSAVDACWEAICENGLQRKGDDYGRTIRK